MMMIYRYNYFFMIVCPVPDVNAYKCYRNLENESCNCNKNKKNVFSSFTEALLRNINGILYINREHHMMSHRHHSVLRKTIGFYIPLA